MIDGKTWQEVCEIISGAMVLSNFAEPLTPRQVYHMHPKGEVFHVYELYEIAIAALKGLEKTEEDARRAALPDEVEA